jgi:hypothetical protein
VSEPIKVENCEHVAGAQIAEAGDQARSIGLNAAQPIVEDLFAARSRQRIDLAIENLPLFARRDAGISNQSHGASPVSSTAGA